MASETMPSPDTRDVEPPAETEQERIQGSPPSTTGPPTAIGASLQQASAPPGDGNKVLADPIKKPSGVGQDEPDIHGAEPPPHGPTFKEQVYGYARLIRGKVLGQPGAKEQGSQVLRGEQGIPLRRGSQSSK